jgi:hypothetical protein
MPTAKDFATSLRLSMAAVNELETVAATWIARLLGVSPVPGQIRL